MDDFALLQAYVRNRSDAAFGELVRRHVDLVYTAARRRTSDAHLAEDVTQAVFIVLARKAASLKSNVILPAWLLHVTRLTASNALRTRKNQMRIERKAASMTSGRTVQQPSSCESVETTRAAEDARVAPLLDDAIAGLPERDRNALVLRYFARCSLAEVGQRLGVTPAAAEKRVSRATDRLRQSLVRGGVVLSLIGLAQILADSGVSAAPADIAGKLTSAIATDTAGIQITPSVELANHTMQALRSSALKPLLTSTAALVAASFVAGILLTYFLLNHRGAQEPRPQGSGERAVVPATTNEETIAVPPVAEEIHNPVQPAQPPIAKIPDGRFDPPEQLVPAEGPHINLLNRVDIAADNLNGEWTQAPGVLQSGVYAYSLVQLPYVPPEEYDYHATFIVQKLRGEVVMLCARKGADFGWQMGARENRTTLFDISPAYNPNNPSRRDTEAVFTAGVPYEVTVQVRNNGVAAYIDGKLTGKLATNYLGFGAFEFWQLQNRAVLGVGTWGTPAQFSRLEVVEVSGHGKWLRAEGQPAIARARPAPTPAADWSKAVDLMPLIDPDRDAVSGTWVRNNEGALVSDKGSLARLEIPYNPPEQYDYKMVFTRNTGWDTIAQCFGQNRNSLFWGMAMWGNELNMFRCVSAFDGTNPTTVWAKEFIENGRRYESVVQVRKQGYAAFIDGKLISFWDRGYKGSHTSKEWRLPTPGALGIGSSSSQTTFHSLQVLEITGKGSAIPTTASKRIEAPPPASQPEAPQAPSVVKPPKPPPDAF